MNKIVIFTIVLAFAATAFAQTCDSAKVAQCAVDYASCALGKLTDINAICACYSPYVKCWFTSNCASGDNWTAFVKACTDSGCTAAQCNSASTVSAVFGLAVAAVAALF